MPEDIMLGMRNAAVPITHWIHGSRYGSCTLSSLMKTPLLSRNFEISSDQLTSLRTFER
jgi:hypothetical protein